MKLKMLKSREIWGKPFLEKDAVYEVVDIVQDTYKVKVPMKQKGKFRYALVKDDEGELID